MIIKSGIIMGKAQQVFDLLDELAKFAQPDRLLAENPFQLDHFESQANNDWWELKLLLRLN